MLLYDFSTQSAALAWQAIDDRVMGGVSTSELVGITRNDTEIAVFRGDVSLQNNGGFCSVRANLSERIAPGAVQLWINCFNNWQMGDKTYQLNLRTNNGFDGVSYRASFAPDADLAQYDFTIDQFEPVFRGRKVLDAPALTLSDVRQVGLMVSDAQVGVFELFIQDIGVRLS